MDRCSEQFVGFRVVNEFSLEGHRTVAFSNSASPEIIWGLGGPEEDHQLHHHYWTGRVSEREEEVLSYYYTFYAFESKGSTYIQ